jgi:hypothetical protein
MNLRSLVLFPCLSAPLTFETSPAADQIVHIEMVPQTQRLTQR